MLKHYHLLELTIDDVLFQGNAIYNILPDVISRLSDPDVGIAEDNFQEIMRYIISAKYTLVRCRWLTSTLAEWSYSM